MRQQYDANPWGWDAAAKWSELAHDDARFVLVRGGGGAIQAFAHFRFDVNDEDYASRAVLYVRELQVAQPFRSSGLGARIMNLLQRVAGGVHLVVRAPLLLLEPHAVRAQPVQLLAQILRRLRRLLDARLELLTLALFGRQLRRHHATHSTATSTSQGSD